MQKILILVNGAAYGTGKAYNALRLANIEVRIFLTADGHELHHCQSSCAKWLLQPQADIVTCS